jgi:dTDP-4-amino-4,6-dideoxygalactose transaminase
MYNRFVRSGTVNAHVETRLSPIQAGVGLVQMRALKNTQGRREALAKRLIAVLPPTWIPQALTAEQTHAWYFLVVTCPEPDRAVRDLLQRGVDVGRAPMRNCAAIDDAGAGPTQFSVAQSLMERSLQIPIHPTMDDAMMDHLVEAVRTLPR